MKPSKADAVKKAFKEMKKWNEEKKSYITNANGNQLMPSAANIFVIECEYLSLDKDESVPQKNQRIISLLVSSKLYLHSSMCYPHIICECNT